MKHRRDFEQVSRKSSNAKIELIDLNNQKSSTAVQSRNISISNIRTYDSSTFSEIRKKDISLEKKNPKVHEKTVQIRKRFKAAINNDKSSLLPAIKAYIDKWQDTDNARLSKCKPVKLANGATTSTSIGKYGHILDTRPRGTNNRYRRLEIAVKMLNRDEIKCRSNDTKRNYDNIQIEVHARAINIANDGILKLNDDDNLKKLTIENFSSVNRRLQFTKKIASVPKMNRQTKSVSQGQSLAYTLLKSN